MQRWTCLLWLWRESWAFTCYYPQVHRQFNRLKRYLWVSLNLCLHHLLSELHSASCVPTTATHPPGSVDSLLWSSFCFSSPLFTLLSDKPSAGGNLPTDVTSRPLLSLLDAQRQKSNPNLTKPQTSILSLPPVDLYFSLRISSIQTLGPSPPGT